MSPQIPEELISAYFDGEVTAEERATVESYLAGSEEAQRELNETARLSALLHSFPREVAPASLAAGIEERTSSLPLPTVSRTPRSGSVPLWPQVRAAVVSAVTTAAAFLLILRAIEPGTVTSTALNAPATGVAERETPVPGGAPEFASMEMDQTQPYDKPTARAGSADKLAESQQMRKLQDPQPAEGANSYALKGDNAPKAAALVMRQGPVDAPAPPPPAPAPGDAPATVVADAQDPAPTVENFMNPLTNGAYLDQLQRGQIYTFVPQPADPETSAGVVDMMVVDVDRAAETMQVLLGQPQVQRDGGQDRKQKSGDEELVILYAQAPADRIAKALNDVTLHPDLFVGWSAQLPLELTEVEELRKRTKEKDTDEAQQVVEALVRRNRTAGVSGSVAASGSVALGANVAELDAGNAARSEGSPLRRALTTAPGAAKSNTLPALNSSSEVAVVRLPKSERGLNFSRSRAGTLNQLETLPSRREYEARDAAALNLPRNETGNRTVRMLFVLHPSVGEPPAEPAAPRPGQ